MTKLHHLLGASALFTASLAASFTAQAAGSLLITPAASSVATGDSFAVQVRGSGFTDNIVGGGFNLAFDPGVLTLTSVQVDTGVWEFISSPGSIDNAAGKLSDVYFNSFKAVLPTGNFAVATLNFSAKAPGASSLSLGASAGFPFANDAAEVVGVSFGSASVNVSAVPEPGSLAMLLAGLLGVGAALRRRQG